MNDHETRVLSLLARALEVPRPERSTWLRQFEDDLSLIHEVRELLHYSERHDNPLNDAPPFEQLLDVLKRFPSLDERLNAPHCDTKILAFEAYLPKGPSVISKLKGYTLEGEIARGGMGVVYRARETKHGEPVAVKFLIGGSLAQGELRQRFLNEAKILARLDHPNIVAIRDFGEQDGLLYFSMPIAGRSLWDLRRIDFQTPYLRPMRPRHAVMVMSKVAEALKFAHERGVIHRDIKPGNILIDDSSGEPRVADFGLAKWLPPPDEAAISRVSQAGTPHGRILGSPSYMSPEQAAGRVSDVGRLSDVYSVGATLYCLLCGAPPFCAKSNEETLEAVRESEAPSVRSLNPSIPLELEAICRRAMQKEPQQRYASMTDMQDDLNRFLIGDFAHARPVGFPEEVQRSIAASVLPSVILLFVLTCVWRLGNVSETAPPLMATQPEPDLQIESSKIPPGEVVAAPRE